MKTKKKICVNIGHGGDSKHYDSGAVSLDGKLEEHSYNKNILGPLIISKLQEDYDVMTVIQQKSFGELPSRINALSPDITLSLHLNASDGTGNGPETLFYHTSKNGKRLAQLIQTQLVLATGLKDRGIKPKKSGDRGAALLKNTSMPTILLETGFIDNKNDMVVIARSGYKIAEGVKNAVDEYFNQ